MQYEQEFQHAHAKTKLERVTNRAGHHPDVIAHVTVTCPIHRVTDTIALEPLLLGFLLDDRNYIAPSSHPLDGTTKGTHMQVYSRVPVGSCENCGIVVQMTPATATRAAAYALDHAHELIA